ncbi:hypothetical protein EJB05_16432 [Eragrostis curvula]|uniref:Uncharacterized protein n=1 Tax=Eragrostis curvula TaxID=38414 RepID=A0A5J9VF55_9POAL|nr:hypothetical protein EJB05_16432 [Eragrostis curvula]
MVSPEVRTIFCRFYFISVVSSNQLRPQRNSRTTSEYTATFQRLESRPSNPAHGAASLGSSNQNASITDNSLAETFQLVSRPLPYDTDPRYARVQREGLVSRREKSINLTQEESLALRRNGSSSAIEHLASQKKRSSIDTEPECKVRRSESTKSLSAKAYSSSYAGVTSEDEDVCPTCLEGLYSSFNTPQTTQKSLLNVVIIFILVVFTNGWREVIPVQFVGRKWSFVKVHDMLSSFMLATSGKGNESALWDAGEL